MTHPLRTSEDYELFLYTLTEQFPSVCKSTVIREIEDLIKDTENSSTSAQD